MDDFPKFTKYISIKEANGKIHIDFTSIHLFTHDVERKPTTAFKKWTWHLKRFINR